MAHLKSSMLMVLLLAVGVIAQDETRPLPSPAEIARMLQANTCTIGLEKLESHLQIWRGKESCTSELATVNYVSLQEGAADAVIIAERGDELSFVVLRKDGPEWEFITSRTITSAYDRPTITFPHLIQRDVQEIAVSQETLVRGSGVLQNQFVVYKLFARHLDLIFDAASKTVLSGWGTDTDRSSDSDFKIEEATAKETGSIYQRTTYHDHDHVFVTFTSYEWDPEVQRFRPFPLADLTEKGWKAWPK